MQRVLLWLSVAVLASSVAMAGDIGYIEEFALAGDRAAALRQLIPGTEDYYYYHCLHFLDTEQFEKVDEFTKPWLQRFGMTSRLREILTRHVLLTYDRNPQKSLEYLRNHLDLRFNHERTIAGAAPNLPTALDPKLINRETLRAHSLTQWKNLDNFEESALEWLAADNLDWERRRNLLQRLTGPDVPNLPQLIAADLAAPHPEDFGSYAIHKQLTLAQLEELLKLRGELLNHVQFVQIWISKLQPGADDDWRHDSTLTRAYLDRLWSFVSRLAPAQNALKAHVLYHRLALDRSSGVYDKPRFLAYLALPRRQPYMAKTLLEKDEAQRFPADLSADFRGITLLRPVGADEELVRDYLKHFLLTADAPREFEPYIHDEYLRHLFAETKIENGLGDPEQWASQLPPEQFRRLKERTDIDFAPTNKTDFTDDEPVRLDLVVKNVPTMLVKVFEINTVNYYRTHQQEVNTDINLDGLVASSEQNFGYGEPPLRRIARRFDFPQLNRPGVYIVDFIGNGQSSRALIRKGRLRPIVSTGTAGQVINVVDDSNRPVKDARVWFGGVEALPDEDGRSIIPFSTSPGRRAIVLRRGDFASLDFINHEAETYELKAGIHIDRESLLTQRTAGVLVRPGLYLNGTPVAIKLLEEVRLRITASDHNGIVTTVDIPNFKLFEDRESVYDFRVPPRLAALSVGLHAKVQNLSESKKVDISAEYTITLNGIDRTPMTEDLHLAKFGGDYVLELLGRTGEAKADRPVQLALKHRDFRQPVQTTLKTDKQGRARLGSLADIVSMTATGPEGTAHTWKLLEDKHDYRYYVHAKAGEVVRLPYMGASGRPTHEDLSLYEVADRIIRADRFDAVSVNEGMLELKGLAPGDYELWLKRSHEHFLISIADGTAQGNYVLGKRRFLQLPALKPLQIAGLEADAEQVTARLINASPFARVHVFATRYLPANAPFTDLQIGTPELGGVYPAHAESVYVAGRNIGDEYRYVLDRRSQKKYPGNMLERPHLLLNPWAVRSTESGEHKAEAGDEFQSKSVPSESAGIGQGSGPGKMKERVDPGQFANLDFLADAAAAVVNLVPDKEGVIKVPRKALGPHALIHVVAVDPLTTAYRSITLPEQQAHFVDLRLKNGLNPQGHFTQQKQVTILEPRQPFVLHDVASSRFEAYDSLAKVYGLYTTFAAGHSAADAAHCAEFAFILNWPMLKPEERRELYSKYACHELNFFLAKKDPAFFQAVVGPYLANKKDKTFLDHWLAGDNLTGYLEPWEYSRLNTVERILLAQRLPGEAPRTARHINDLVRLQPFNSERFLNLFDTAINGSALGRQDAIGLKELQDEMRVKKMSQLAGEAKPEASTLAITPPPPNAPATAPEAAKPTDPSANDFAAGRNLQEMRKKRWGDAGYAESSKQRGANSDGQDKAGGARAGTSDKEKLGEMETGNSSSFGFHVNDRDRIIRRQLQLYRRLEPTMEWAENNYYHLPIQQQVAELIPVSSFWLDYAKHEGKGPFLSRYLAEASRNFTEMMLALAVLDLPFEAPKHEVAFKDDQMTLTPAGNVIALHEEVRPVEGSPAADAARPAVMVTQNFYRNGDRFREVEGEKLDKFVTGEFLTQSVYGCQIVVTNPTSAKQKLNVLYQVPVGAIPVGNGQFTKSVLMDLEPYHTQTIDYLFYFPFPGKFAQFPVHVAVGERRGLASPFVAAAAANFTVVEKLSKPDTSSWEYISQNGTNEEVLSFLTRENVQTIDLEKIAFRMRDRGFFESVLQVLRDRHAYHHTLWSYALFHNQPAAIRQYLTQHEQIVAECDGPIRSPLLTLDPVARHQYEHLEYKPLVNARAHSLGKQRQIVNEKILQQYHRFLKLLSYRTQLNDDDKLAVVYYFLLQDRIEEALTTFAQVNPEAVVTRTQYDYVTAYLALYSDEPQRARAVCARYADYPVDRWRKAFTAITHQLDEAAGKAPQIADKDDRTQKQGQLAATEPGVEFTLANKQLHLTWQNVEQAQINFYLMDVELLFSREPFVAHGGSTNAAATNSGPFASIKPNATNTVKLPAGKKELTVPIPEDLIRRNVLVEVSAAGKTRSRPYFANAMDVKLQENYGQLHVAEAANGKALPKVYVKVYAQAADGHVKFHKDGYTDHRGRFDYATVSVPAGTSPAARFAILVLSEDRGATIRETAPPQQ